MSEDLYFENEFMKAGSVEELRAMEKTLYDESFRDGQLIPGQEGYYQHQMELFTQAFATLFPEDYDFHKSGKKP